MGKTVNVVISDATAIADIPDKEKDDFGYPLGTIWRRVKGASHVFVPHDKVVRVGAKLFDKEDSEKIQAAKEKRLGGKEE